MKVFLAAVFLCAGVTALRADDKVEPKGDKVEFDVHNGHFVSNKYEMKGDSAYLAIADRDNFDKIFGIGRVIGKQNFVPKDAFEKKIVVATIKKGAALTEYKVEKVTADGETLYIQYTSETKGSATGTAQFASPMIVSVDKGRIKKVIFIENGKKAETVEVAKGS